MLRILSLATSLVLLGFGANLAYSQQTDIQNILENRDFETDLNTSINALKEVLAIYGEKNSAALAPIEIKKIQGILQKTQKSAFSIYDDKVVYGAGDKVIYGIGGKDDRINLFKASANQKIAAKSVALVINSSELLESADPQKFNLPSSPVGLCSDERFSSEPAPGNCSAFRVGNELIATAGHCIMNQSQCQRTSFVFGFSMDNASAKPHKGIKKSNVYECKSIVDGELNGPDQSDWRVVRVTRPMAADIPIVELRKNGQIDTGDEITVIGHPMGLPLKVTPGGFVRAHRSSYFVATPDTYGGNSGSPVFNSAELQTGRLFLEGILVRGEDDFVQFEPCMKSKHCEENGCRGEDITYAREFVAAISEE